MKPPAGLPSAIPQKQHSKLNQVCTCHSREVKSGNTWSTLSSSSSSSCSSSSINRCLALKEKGSVLKWTIKRSNNAYVMRISAHGKQISKRETHTQERETNGRSGEAESRGYRSRSRSCLCCGKTSVWSAPLPRFSHVYWTSATLLRPGFISGQQLRWRTRCLDMSCLDELARVCYRSCRAKPCITPAPSEVRHLRHVIFHRDSPVNQHTGHPPLFH